MRRYLISIAAAASVAAFAVPADAQPHGNMTPYAAPVYNYSPYNFARGYNGYAFSQQMRARVQRIRVDIRNMEARRILSVREARSLDRQARTIERQIYRAPRNGLRVAEARGIENRIRNLEIRVSREARDWNNRPGHYRR
ncbi:MAG: hypothetical protein ACTHN4_02325 [Sphingomicrobium sp.]